MKKWFAFCFVFLFLFVIVSKVHAASDVNTLADQVEVVQNKVDNAQDIITSPDKDKIAGDYLKKEWGKILETKPIIGEIIRGYNKISPYTDPVVEWFVGIVPSLSWLFLLTFLVWFTFLRYTYIGYEYFADAEIFEKNISMIIYYCLIIIFLTVRVFQNISMWISTSIIDFISITFGTWWGQTILVVGTIIVLTLFNMVQKTLRVYLRKMRMDKYQAKIKKVAKEEEKEMKEKDK